MSYVAPGFQLGMFTCPHCNALSHMDWSALVPSAARSSGETWVYSSICVCNKECYWLHDGASMAGNQAKGTLIYPSNSNAPHPHEDMPPDIAADFEEARSVFTQSPRSSAALLRLCLEKLCAHLLGEHNQINVQIKKLVGKGLPVEVQQALDATRIVGNNAIHIIELDIAKNPDLAGTLFGLINFIVDNRISQPAKIRQFYEQMPKGALEAIEKRDTPKSQ